MSTIQSIRLINFSMVWIKRVLQQLFTPKHDSLKWYCLFAFTWLLPKWWAIESCGYSVMAQTRSIFFVLTICHQVGNMNVKNHLLFYWYKGKQWVLCPLDAVVKRSEAEYKFKSWIFEPYRHSTSKPSKHIFRWLVNYRACAHQFHSWPIASSQWKCVKYDVLWIAYPWTLAI